MVQILITYALVALAAAWVGWKVLLPRRVRAAVKARLPHRAKAVAAGPAKSGCDCGDGGCH